MARRIASFRRQLLISSSAAAAAVAAVALVSCPKSAGAATLTWDGGGGDDNLATATNWTTDVAPVANDLLVFAGTVRPTPNNNFAAGTAFNGLTFSAGTAAFTLGGNAFVLGTPGAGTPASGNITNSSSNLQTITTGLTLAAGNHTIAGGTPGLALNTAGGLAHNIGTSAIFSGTVSSNTITNSGGGILGGYAFVGTNWATHNGTNVVALASYTDVTTSDAIVSNTASNVRINSGAAGTNAVAADTDINTLMQNVNNIAQTVSIAGGATLRLGVNGGIYRTQTSNTANAMLITGGFLTAGGNTIDTAGEIVYNAGANTNTTTTNRIDSVIKNNGTGVVSFVKTGRAYLALGAANTYTGNTYVNEGRIQAITSTSLGTGDVYIQSGGQVLGSGIANNFYIAGNGPQNEAGAAAIRGGGTMTGRITLLADAAIAGSSVTFTGKITGDFGLTVGSLANFGGSGLYNDTLANPVPNGDISGNGNDWTGNTTIVSRTSGVATNTLVLGATEQIPSGASAGNVIIGNAGINASSVAALNLNGFNETINGLSHGTTPASATQFVVTNNGGTAATLTLGDNNANGNFAGAIQDGAAQTNITKIGTGTQTLSGTNSYTGATNIDGGALIVSGSLSTSGAVNVNASPSSAGALYGAGTVGNVTLAADNGSNVAKVNPGATGPGSIGTLNAASLSVNGGQLQFDLGAPGVADLINSSGAVSFNAASSVLFAGGSVGSTYTVISSSAPITYTVTPTVAPSTDPNVRPTTYTLDTITDTTQLLVNVTGGGALALTWTGAAANDDWDINTTTNWQNPTPAPDKFFNLDTVTFADGPTDRHVNITTTVQPASVTVNNSTGNDYTFSGTGSIAGTGSLTKSGSGTLTLSNTNSYAGGTTINAGTVIASGSGSLGAGPVNLAGGTLTISNTQSYTGGTIITSGTTLQVGTGGTAGTLGAGNVTNDGSLVSNRSDNVTIANTISGAGTVTQNGTGRLTLSVASTYFGGTTVNAGLLRLSNATAAGSGPITLNSGTTLVVNNVSAANTVTVNSAGLAATGGDSTLSGEVTINGNATVYTVDPLDLAGTTRNMILGNNNTGGVHGSGNITVIPSTAVIDPDGGQGFRFRGSLSSDYGGTVTLGNSTKVEIQTNAASGSPAGTADFVVTAGDAKLDGTSEAVTNAGGYSTFNIRNNSSGNSVLGNDVSVSGSGLAMLNVLGSFPTGSVTTLGNLRVGAGQQVGTTNSDGRTLAFQSVTLTGGNATFSPKVSGFGTPASEAADLQLVNIGESAAGSGIVMSGLKTLTLTGTHTYTGSTSVSAGKLTIAGSLTTTSAANVTGGTLEVASDGSATRVLKATSVSVTGSGKIDLTDNKLITQSALGTWDGSAYTGITGLVQTGRGDGTWNGNGIVTSMTDATTGVLTTLAVASGAEVRGLGPTDTDLFMGQTINGDSTIVMYTWGGDADLNGELNGDDYFFIDSNAPANGSVFGYHQGDFDYNGTIDGDDYFVIDSNITFAQASPNWPTASGGGGGLAAVPEPASIGALGLAAASLIGRRRRRV